MKNSATQKLSNNDNTIIIVPRAEDITFALSLFEKNKVNQRFRLFILFIEDLHIYSYFSPVSYIPSSINFHFRIPSSISIFVLLLLFPFSPSGM